MLTYDSTNPLIVTHTNLLDILQNSAVISPNHASTLLKKEFESLSKYPIKGTTISQKNGYFSWKIEFKIPEENQISDVHDQHEELENDEDILQVEEPEEGEEGVDGGNDWETVCETD